jgi:Asp/Glu/hydantoin racemase
MDAAAFGIIVAGPMDDVAAQLNQTVHLPFIGPVTAGTAILGGGVALLIIGWFFLRRK